MFLTDAITQYITYAKNEQGLSPRTLTVYEDRLKAFSRWCDGLHSPSLRSASSLNAPSATVTKPIVSLEVSERLDKTVVREYLYALSDQNLRPRTVRNRLCPLRSLSTYLVSIGKLESNPLSTLTLPKKDAATRHVVGDEDLSRLLDAVERQTPGRRLALERAILYTLAFSGVRFSELLDIRIGHFNAGEGTLLVAHGKGEKSRTLYPPQDCVSAIAIWLTERAKMNCKHDYLWAFDTRRRMGEIGTRALLEDIKARAGLAGAEHIKPHAFRRGMATRMIRAGADILSVGAALGHSQITTTLLYTAHRERPAERMRDTAALLPGKNSVLLQTIMPQDGSLIPGASSGTEFPRVVIPPTDKSTPAKTQMDFASMARSGVAATPLAPESRDVPVTERKDSTPKPTRIDYNRQRRRLPPN